MADNIHDKHRERVRKDFLAHGFDETTPLHKVLEMLLFYSIPRKDTNEIAHALKERFGTLENILEAEPQELKKVDGVGDNTVAFFRLLVYITKTYRVRKQLKKDKFNTMEDITDFLFARYLGYTKETFSVMTFNSRGEMLGFDVINEGDVSSVGVSTREILEVVFKHNAATAMIIHNHPGGSALPSDADVSLTERIATALTHINVPLIDHIILADDDYVSMKQSYCYQYIFED